MPDRIPLPEPKWYACMTAPCQEATAALWLARARYHVVNLVDRVQTRIRRPHGRELVQWIERPRFRRYIFVALRYVNEPLGPINDCIGVSRIVSRPMSGEPLQIPNDVMDGILDGRLFALDDGRGTNVLTETHRIKDRDVRVFMGHLGRWKAEWASAA